MRCAILRLTSRASQAAKSARLRGNPIDDFMQGRGPPSSAGLQDQRTEGGAQGGHLRGGVQKGVLATHPPQKGRRRRRKPGGGGKRWKSPKPQQTQKTREEPTRQQGGDHHQEGEERGNHRGRRKRFCRRRAWFVSVDHRPRGLCAVVEGRRQLHGHRRLSRDGAMPGAGVPVSASRSRVLPTWTAMKFAQQFSKNQPV